METWIKNGTRSSNRISWPESDGERCSFVAARVLAWADFLIYFWRKRLLQVSREMPDAVSQERIRRVLLVVF